MDLRQLWIVIPSILLIVSFVVWWKWPSPTSSPRPAGSASAPLTSKPDNTPSSRKYVGGQTCATCHSREYQLWSGSHHDLAMQEPDEETVLGNFNNTTFTHFGLTSRFYMQEGKYFVQTDGPDGALNDYEIAYTFGAHPLQQYLIQFPGGRYQALGIAWDNRPQNMGGQRWFHLYPNEKIPHDDELHWTGANQNWNYMCADCHSTNLQKNYQPQDDRYDTTWTDIDVACEACHGPGSQHVSWAKSVESKDTTTHPDDYGLSVQFPAFSPQDWQIQPGNATATQNTPSPSRSQIETCARCHSRRTAISKEYVPGQPFLDAYLPTLLEERLYHPDGQIDEEVYVYGSFIQSKMYHRGVTCSDCHEPHSLQLRASGNALCTRCHLPETFDLATHHFHKVSSAGAQCVECHMPPKHYMVVDPRRDHSLRLPNPLLSKQLGTPNACNQCHQDQSQVWAANAIKKWYGTKKNETPHYGTVLRAGRERLIGADEALTQLIGEPTQPGIVRATAFTLLGPYPTPEILQAIKKEITDQDPLVRIGALHALELLNPEYRYSLAQPLITDPIRAVRVEAGRRLASIPTGKLSAAQRNDLNKSVKEYIQSQLVNAERPSSHLNLGILFAEQGEYENAEKAYRTALRLDPSFYPALVNLADLYRVQQRDEEGEAALRQALSLASDDANVHHSLGLLLVRVGKTKEAIASFERAMTLGPEDPRHGYVYGIALNSIGEPTKAIAVLEKVHHRNPTDRQSLFTLVSIHREQGNQQLAVNFAEKLVALAPNDPSAQQVLEQLRTGGNK